MEQVSAVISATNANVKRSRIKRRSNGLYKMTSVFTGGTDASTIKVDIVRTGDKSPKPLITTFTLKVVGKEENGNFIAEKDFDCIKGKDCLFAKDADPVGYSYKITTVVLDKVDKAISKKVTTEVVAEQEFSAKIKPSGIKVRRLRNRYRITSTRMKILSSRKEDSSFIAENTSIKAEISRVSEGSPKPLITSFTINTTGKDKNGNYISERDFDCIKGKDCLFGIEDNTLGEAYKITMVVVDKNGNAISEKVSTEVKVSLDEECKVKYSLEEMSISGFNFYAPYSEKNTSEYPMLVKRTGTKTNTISIPVSFHRGGGLCVLSGSVRTRKWSKSSSETNVKFNAIFNEKTQTLTANLPDMDSVYLLGFTTKSTICLIKYITHEVNFNKI